MAKGLPTLTMRVVERIWNLEFVEMEDLLPAPRSLRLAEQGTTPKSLQDSLVGALSHFQALQQHKAQRRVSDITTWVKCFSLYMAVLAKSEPAMVPSMVAHLHTVLHLHQRAIQHLAWLEYDIQFRMELAASVDKGWKEGNPWQYVACLPGQRQMGDFYFDAPDGEAPPKGKGKREEGHGTGGREEPKAEPQKAQKGSMPPFQSGPEGLPVRERVHLHASLHQLRGSRRPWAVGLPHPARSLFWPKIGWWLPEGGVLPTGAEAIRGKMDPLREHSRRL